jgi:hypothetical protein
MGDQMPLIGMIPEPAGIFNQLAVMGDQRVIVIGKRFVLYGVVYSDRKKICPVRGFA